MKSLSGAGLLLAALLWSTSEARPAALLDEDYNQWKQALATNQATAAEHITRPSGFQIQLIRSATKSEGSWVAMTFDPKGRVIVAREDRGLLRLTLATNNNAPVRVETINTNLLECRGLLFAHGALYANANNSRALVRLRDGNGDDLFEEITVLRKTPGDVGHGRNQLVLGPDGMIYSIHGDDVGLPAEGVAASSPLKHYAEDRLLPCAWDRHLFNATARMPFGHLIRTDPEGKRWELVAGGLRNPFGIDFNAAGDLFTFDADMEWDAGLSWYHPTRVLHLVPGGDYGWRRGTGVLPVWSPDTLPSAVDIGASSPTAIKFGTRSNWPEPWRSALFILDWSYGRILAVHLKPKHSTYTGHFELFLKGRPLNVTGVEFGPDGAMYFITGGRRTQSGLYRVSYDAAPESRLNAPPKTDTDPATPGQAPRHQHSSGTNLWDRLNHSDHWVRYAARVELESTPSEHWAERALAAPEPTAGLTALLALSRTGNRALQPQILTRLQELTSRKLTPEQQLIAIRALAVCFLRMGAAPSISEQLRAQWEPVYPGTDSRVNQSLCELLVYLNSTQVVSKTIPLLESAATQEEKFHYLFTLRSVTNGWTLPHRQTYFSWLDRARREFNGANMLPTAINYIRADAEATLTQEERASLSDIIAALNRPAVPDAAPASARSFVKEWSMADFTGITLPAARARNASRGKQLFAEAACLQCHRMASEGGFIGPDLTSVASRFDRRTLLESIIEPSRVISETYRTVTVTLKSGAILDGRILSEDEKAIAIAINPVDPDQRRRVSKSEILSQRVSEVSPMPAGLLNTLTRDEILELIAWIESGAEASNSRRQQ